MTHSGGNTICRGREAELAEVEAGLAEIEAGLA